MELKKIKTRNYYEEYWVNTITNKKEGLYTRRNLDGSMIRKCEYSNDKLNGLYINYYQAIDCVSFKNSILEICNYLNGKPTGRYTRFYPNKQKMEQIDYIDGIAHGTYISWYS